MATKEPGVLEWLPTKVAELLAALDGELSLGAPDVSVAGVIARHFCVDG